MRTDFKSKKIRVPLNAPIKSEQKQESADVMKTVDEDRRLLIQVRLIVSSCYAVPLTRRARPRLSLFGPCPRPNRSDRSLTLAVPQYHEVAQDPQAPGSHPRSHQPANLSIQTRRIRYQKGIGYPDREGSCPCPNHASSFPDSCITCRSTFSGKKAHETSSSTCTSTPADLPNDGPHAVRLFPGHE